MIRSEEKLAYSSLSLQLLILLLQFLAVHGVTYYFSGKPKPWLATTQETTSQEKINTGKNEAYDGNIIYAFDTATGIYAYQAAAPKLLRTGETINGVEGSYSYTSPDGTKVIVTYTADENGYHPHVSIARYWYS